MTSVYFAITLRELYASSKPTLHDLHQRVRELYANLPRNLRKRYELTFNSWPCAHIVYYMKY